MAYRTYHNASFRHTGSGYSPSITATGRPSQDEYSQRMVPSYFGTSDLYVRGYVVVESGSTPGSTPFRLRRNNSATILSTDTVNVNAVGYGSLFTFAVSATGIWTPGEDWFTIGWTPTTGNQVWILRLVASDNSSFT